MDQVKQETLLAGIEETILPLQEKLLLLHQKNKLQNLFRSPTEMLDFFLYYNFSSDIFLNF